MDLTVNQSIKLKITRQFVVVGMLFGITYIFLLHGITEPFRYVNGIVVGLLIGLILATLELSFFSRGAKKVKFIWLLIVRTLVYLILIIGIIFNVVAFSRMFLWDTGYLMVLSDSRFYNDYLIAGDFSIAVIYTLLFAFSVNFVRMISRKMGQGILLSYIRGTYYKPIHQTRIIMFANLAENKNLIKALDPRIQHKFLNEFFYDLTVPIVRNRGIIYEYVEDQIVISWALDKGLKDASCIRLYFDLIDTIIENKEKYLESYGFVPKLHASLHTGSVVRAEIGKVKSKIAFHGDTMNTTARILGECNKIKKSLIVSDLLIRMIGLPNIYSKDLIGEVNLRGKEESLKLFEIKDKI